MQFIRTVSTNLGVVGSMFRFMWKRKLWWLIPMVAVLLTLGLLIVLAAASGVGPFIYTLF